MDPLHVEIAMSCIEPVQITDLRKGERCWSVMVDIKGYAGEPKLWVFEHEVCEPEFSLVYGIYEDGQRSKQRRVQLELVYRTKAEALVVGANRMIQEIARAQKVVQEAMDEALKLTGAV